MAASKPDPPPSPDTPTTVVHAAVAITLIAGATVLAAMGAIAEGTVIIAWTLAGAIAGSPIILRRNGRN